MTTLRADFIRLEDAGPQGLLSVVRVEGRLICFGLEPPYSEDKEQKPRAIPKGTYKAKRAYFKGKLCWRLEKVPGFEGVFIHNGNHVGHTLGCPVLGLQVKQGKDRWVLRSSKKGEALDCFMAATESAQELSVTFSNRW